VQSSRYGSFEHFLFQNASFLFHQGLQYVSCCRCFLFKHCTETETEAVTLPSYWTAKEESPASGANPEDKPGLCLYTTDTKKQGYRIIINLYSYFHSLILNSLIPMSISTGFSVSLLAQLEMLPTACVKPEGAGSGCTAITCCSHQSHVEVLPELF